MSSATLIQGQKYQPIMHEIEDPSAVKEEIFIPTYQLKITQDGRVNKAESRSMTLAAVKARKLVYYKMNTEAPRDASGKFTDSMLSMISLVNQATEEADKTALTPVQISKEIVDQIKELYEKSVDANTPQGQVLSLTRDIAQIIRDSHLFNG